MRQAVCRLAFLLAEVGIGTLDTVVNGVVFLPIVRSISVGSLRFDYQPLLQLVFSNRSWFQVPVLSTVRR